MRAAKEKLDSWFPSSVWLIPARQRTGDTRRLLVKAEWIFHIKTFEFIFVDILKTSIYYLLLFSALHLHNRLFCMFLVFFSYTEMVLVTCCRRGTLISDAQHAHTDTHTR